MIDSTFVCLNQTVDLFGTSVTTQYGNMQVAIDYCD